jgi:hypothetical protein
MRFEYDRDSVAEPKAICLAAPDADCRLQPADHNECQCEWWGRIDRDADGTIWHPVGDRSEWHHGDRHQLVPGDDCNVCLFINESGYVGELTPDGEDHHFVIADVPFEPVWENDGCSWRPIHTTTTDAGTCSGDNERTEA